MLKLPYRLSLLCVLAVMFSTLAAPGTSAAQTMYGWNGTWSIGATLDATDCDTDQIRFLRAEEIGGLVSISKTTLSLNGKRQPVIRAAGLQRNWLAASVKRKTFKATHKSNAGSAIIKETITISDVSRGEGYVTLKGRVAYLGSICTYEYFGSIAKL